MDTEFQNRVIAAQEIKTVDDVIAFVKQLQSEGMIFNPYDDFTNYINLGTDEPTYTKEEAEVRNKLMDQCFTVCEKAGVAIYEVMMEATGIKADVLTEGKASEPDEMDIANHEELSYNVTDTAGNQLYFFKAKNDGDAMSHFDIWITEEIKTHEQLLETYILQEINSIRGSIVEGEQPKHIVHTYNKNIQYFDGGGTVTEENKPKPYTPQSDVCETLNTVAPAGMVREMQRALRTLDRNVRGVDLFVQHKLGYNNVFNLCSVFGAEQVDAIALAIWQIEHGQGVIIGDQTGTGKGRCVAGIVRYAKVQGKRPIVFTENPNLFSDLYRDFIDIQADANIPLMFYIGEKEVERKISASTIKKAIKDDIENGDFDLAYNTETLFDKANKEDLNNCIAEYRDLYYPSEKVMETEYKLNKDYKTDVRGVKRIVPLITNIKYHEKGVVILGSDREGEEGRNIIYKPDSPAKTNDFYKSLEMPEGYDMVLTTYSQVSSKKPTLLKEWLKVISKGAILIMDECHNASGESNRGKFFKEIIEETEGVVFLSATYAKRPDNMGVYALKTVLKDTGLTSMQLTEGIKAGGVALQEIISAELVREGQMLRRQKTYDGIKVAYNYLDESMLLGEDTMPQFDLKSVHIAVSNKVTQIIRNIMDFQKDYVNPIISTMDENMAQEQGSMEGTNSEAGIDNYPIFNGIFNIINQLLLSVKSEAVAEWAIMRMKQGKKPVIALSNTMESFLDYLLEENDGDPKVITDFSTILKRRLDSVLRYKENNSANETQKHVLDPEHYPMMGEQYRQIMKDIEETATGINISPIDFIKKKIADAGFNIEEVTGRSLHIEYIPGGKYGLIKPRHKQTATQIIQKFNDNELDCILINQSGSTGISAHAVTTEKVYKVNYNEKGNAIVPTSLDDKAEVKQRIMLVLQAELNVNTEVQKRGRINRTGQLFPPIYEYIFSAIPAEKRMSMMLQKKLKSLDANVSASQKESNAVFQVNTDFLNIYGDDVVIEFLKNNPDFIDVTGNNLKFEKGDPRMPSEETYAIEDRAHKLSGRIAVLSVDRQEYFYNTMTEAYKSYVEDLRQRDKYNLEVERLDLQAKTIKTNVIAVADAGTTSIFGGAVFMEDCEVNNLRKPYTKAELSNALADQFTILDRNDKEIRFDTYKEKTDYVLELLGERIKRNITEGKKRLEDSRKRDIKETQDMPSLEKKKESERKALIEEKVSKINEDYDKKIESLETSNRNIRSRITNLLEFFQCGKLIAYPAPDYKENGNFIKGICLGFLMNFTENNPFAPSKIKVKFVMPNGMRLLTYELSNEVIDKILTATQQMEYNYEHWKGETPESESKKFIQEWEENTKNAQEARVMRKIVTGNLLKAFGDSSMRNGNIVRYTTNEKDTNGKYKEKIGIILPQGTEDKPMTDLKVLIPINKAMKYILNMRLGTDIYMANEDVVFERARYDYVIKVKKGSDKDAIAKDPELTKIAVNPVWDLKRSKGYYVNSFAQEAMTEIIEILWSKYGLQVGINQALFETMKGEFDIEMRSSENKRGEEELIEQWQKELDEYFEKHKGTFKALTEEEKEYSSVEDLEKHEFLKNKIEGAATKKLFRFFNMLKKEVKRRKQEAKHNKAAA